MDGEIREIRDGMVMGSIALCMDCAQRIGVEESVEKPDRGTVCVMCGMDEDMRALPVDCDFSTWRPNVDGRWDAPPWYLNPRVNKAIRIPDDPYGQMAQWIKLLNAEKEG